jgi:hypothetical protein
VLFGDSAKQEPLSFSWPRVTSEVQSTCWNEPSNPYLSCGMLRLPRHQEHNELGYNYKFFGLFFHSNLSVPAIPPEKNSAERWDVALHFGISPHAEGDQKPVSEELTYASSDTNENGEPALQIWKVNQGAFVRMAYNDGTQFWVDRPRENIWATWPDHLPLENTASYLLGPVLGLLLRLRGVICLHASAVAIGDRSVAFVGAPGAGKSTTAAAFSKLGYAILSDDIVALEEQNGAFYALAAHPQLCLWPESVKMLYGSAEALPRLNPVWDKRRLRLGEQGTRFENRALPIEVIYLLGDRCPDPAPSVETMRPQASFLSLVADTYANKILDREMRAREFDVLSRLAAAVPIRRVSPHCDPDRVGDLCRVILEDFATLKGPTRAGH